MKEKINVKLIKGVEGIALLVNDWRVAGSKPWGGGHAIHAFDVSKKDMLEALGRDVTEVVRCWDCVWCEFEDARTDWMQGYYVCRQHEKEKGLDDYCSDGKRKVQE